MIQVYLVAEVDQMKKNILIHLLAFDWINGESVALWLFVVKKDDYVFERIRVGEEEIDKNKVFWVNDENWSSFRLEAKKNA